MKSLIFCMGIICLIYAISCSPERQNFNEYEFVNQHSNTLDELVLSKEPSVMIDQVMEAMGGASKWHDLHYVSWTFFESRHLVWDKIKNRVRIENHKDSSVYLLDMKTNMGRYAIAGRELPEGPQLQAKMVDAKSMWINDMYWLFMPFKLNDPGVNVRYVKEAKSTLNHSCSVFSLTFEAVGETPQNKYDILVDHEDHLIKQWDFYQESSADSADVSWPWDNYKSYDDLLLSAERSDKKGPSNVRVYDTLDDKVFSSLEGFEFY
ncbi:MAG: plasmid maintenance system killer protein [Patiriisocius sp.]|jgi:plasmid maintenance system killer protein